MEKIDYVISSATGATKFKITDIKPYVPVVTLPIQDNTILLQQLKPGFKILCHLQSEKFESLFFKITMFAKPTTCTGLQAEQIFSVNVYNI